MPTTLKPRPSRGGRNRATLIAIPLLILLFLVLFWDWNWFKPLLESRASAALNRQVTIAKLDVRLRWQPWIVIDDLVIANPPEMIAAMPEGSLASIGRLSIHLDPWAWFDGRLVLPDLIIDRLRGNLRPTPSGRGNWLLDLPPRNPLQPGPSIEIGTLSLIDGSAHVLDPVHQADFAISLHTENAQAGDEAQIIATAEGRYNDQPITARLVGGALLGLRDPANPYKIAFTAANGATRIALSGSLLDPLRFGGAQLSLELQGNDLAELFPLTRIPLPQTPPYRLKGRLDHGEQQIRFTDFSGTVGSSDLRGDLHYQPRSDRPEITANLVSRKVVLADLAGFIGAPPGKAGAANDTRQQKRARDRQEAKPSMLPDQPINLPKLRAADMHVSYKAERIETEDTPLDNIIAVLDIVDGKLTMQPLSFAVGSGAIVLNIALDGQQDQVHAVADIDFRKVDLGHILKKSTIFRGSGVIAGTGRIDSTGNSLKTLLGRGDGQLKLFMTGGNLSAILIDLAGLDLGNAVLSALGIPRRTDLRCMIADFGLKDGQVDTRILLLDTTEANVIGSGTINLRDERIDYQLKTEPKHFNFASLPAPILIKGPLKSPRIAPDYKSLALRGAAAAILGVVATPLAALIPTIQFGLGDDNDCVALLKTVGAAPSSKGKTKR